MAYPASFRADLKRTEIWKKRKKLEEKSPCEQFKMDTTTFINIVKIIPSLGQETK